MRSSISSGAGKTLTQALRLLAEGAISAQIAARVPLSEAVAALTLPESRTVLGKVIIVPDA